MKKIFTLLCFILCGFSLFAQATFNYSFPETYIQAVLTKSQLERISEEFSVDKVTRNSDDTYVARLCIALPKYSDFEQTGIPFTHVSTPKANVSMASSYQTLTQNWRKYPTYDAYLETMQTFQEEFPTLCKIDTILAQTPNNHMILAAHICSELNNSGDRPSFFYTSTMHGDEPLGYYLMLRLIHYLLHNYATNGEVQHLVDNIDIWICPLENPDGTYHTSDNLLNESPVSTRYNAHYEDLNRSYPIVGQNNTNGNYEPEVEAMMSFGAAHNFTMSANLHGGSELVNFPWDSWLSNQHRHADFSWWSMIAHQFADDCQTVSQNYMTDQDNGTTPGGDWYVITGSRQDYFNYFQGCREATFELSTNKVVSSNNLPLYWERTRDAFLNYLGECLHGLHGVVTDTMTGAPLSAQIFIENHDCDNSQVHTRLPAGDYHRPIKAGTYQVTYSAEGYFPKTYTLTFVDGEALTQNVQLCPINNAVLEIKRSTIQIFPNPTTSEFIVQDPQRTIQHVSVYNENRQCVKNISAEDHAVKVDLRPFSKGVYVVVITTDQGVVIEKVIKK